MLEVVACPNEGGRMAMVRGGATRDGGLFVGLVECTRCKHQYPVLGGIPILVAQPTQWVASYRDAVLAALSEAGAATRKAIELVDAFAAHAPNAEPMRFGDDWVDAEVIPAHDSGVTILDHGTPTKAFAHFVEMARGRGPCETLLSMLSDRPLGTVVEVGSGAGNFARAIRKQAKRYVVCDLSLRAVFKSLAAARRTRGSLMGGAVVDGDRVRLRQGAVDTVVAAELVDLLADPEDFFDAAARALRRNGRVGIVTPGPDLGTGPDREWALRRVMEQAGLRIAAEQDGVPWIREHSARYFQVYFALAMVAKLGSASST